MTGEPSEIGNKRRSPVKDPYAARKLSAKVLEVQSARKGGLAVDHFCYSAGGSQTSNLLALGYSGATDAEAWSLSL